MPLRTSTWAFNILYRIKQYGLDKRQYLILDTNKFLLPTSCETLRYFSGFIRIMAIYLKAYFDINYNINPSLYKFNKTSRFLDWYPDFSLVLITWKITPWYHKLHFLGHPFKVSNYSICLLTVSSHIQ